MIDLEAIRARDADYNDVFEAQASMSKDIAHRLVAWPVHDRRALLAYVDELRSRLAEAEDSLAIARFNCEAQAEANIALEKRLAEADALIAKGLAVVHDFLPNIGRCVLQDYRRMNEFCSEAAARTAVSAVQPERCCVDYPRCDCNSPAEWPTQEEAEKRAAELMAIGRATLAAADRQVPEGMALHKGEFVTARMVVERLAEAESAYLSAWARLVKEERLHGYAMEERDHAEEMADKLADAIATLLGVEIGEHSNMNCPWEQALEAFEGRAASTVTQDAAP